MSESLGEQIRHILREAPFAMRQLAADSGLSYDVLRSWRSGRRRPSRSSAVRLAAGLQQRGELLLRLAAELQAAAEPPAQASRPREEGAPHPDAGRSPDTGAGRSGEGGNGRTGDGPPPDDGRGRAESGFGVSRPSGTGEAGSIWRHGAAREGDAPGGDSQTSGSGGVERDAPPDEGGVRRDVPPGGGAGGTSGRDTETGTDRDWRS